MFSKNNMSVILYVRKLRTLENILKTNESEEEIASILKCCDICAPNNQEYQNAISQIPTPKTFDHGSYNCISSSWAIHFGS